ncbi:MAG: rRNA maturation RNase YbeY [Oscillospiraceae bacterium]|jgi:probable rRNA maturation factor|nr:rRNA maturation RNase YbeY [Oscillospiraceae bacterium]
MKLNYNNKAKLDKSFRALIKKSCEAVLREEIFSENAEVSVLLTNNEEVRTLNSEFRGKDEPTDVLSFPTDEVNPENGYIMLGDIVINAELAAERAREYGHSQEREIAFLTVHSMLHLLGYEHENDKAGEKLMREKQTKILRESGLNIQE